MSTPDNSGNSRNKDRRKAAGRPVGGGAKNLVNNLSVKDARHLLQLEGGVITQRQAILRLIGVLAVAAFTARAIVKGDATARHLLMPMAVEYLVLLIVIAGTWAVVRHPDMKKDGKSSVVLLLGLVAAFAVYVVRWKDDFSAAHPGMDPTFPAVAMERLKVFWEWVTSSKMAVPMALAGFNMAATFPQRVRNLLQFGPPFSGVGLGCGMRLVLMFAGLFAMPLILKHPNTLVWVLWAVLLGAELLALVMHWDVQQRLKKRDALPGMNLDRTNGHEPL